MLANSQFLQKPFNLGPKFFLKLKISLNMGLQNILKKLKTIDFKVGSNFLHHQFQL
jgi:hypothetical protein